MPAIDYMPLALLLILSLVMAAVAVYVVDIRKRRLVSDVEFPESIAELKYPELVFRQHLSGFYFATRLCSEGMRAYKHKDYDLYLFEMYFGIAYAPYWCSVVYSPYSDDEKAELFVSNHGFEQR